MKFISISLYNEEKYLLPEFWKNQFIDINSSIKCMKPFVFCPVWKIFLWFFYKYNKVTIVNMRFMKNVFVVLMMFQKMIWKCLFFISFCEIKFIPNRSIRCLSLSKINFLFGLLFNLYKSNILLHIFHYFCSRIFVLCMTLGIFLEGICGFWF